MFSNGCIYVIMRLIYYCYLQLPHNSRNSFMYLKPFSKCGLFTALDVVYWMVIEKRIVIHRCSHYYSIAKNSLLLKRIIAFVKMIFYAVNCTHDKCIIFSFQNNRTMLYKIMHIKGCYSTFLMILRKLS